jgi:hypothetical protein
MAIAVGVETSVAVATGGVVGLAAATVVGNAVGGVAVAGSVETAGFGVSIA